MPEKTGKNPLGDSAELDFIETNSRRIDPKPAGGAPLKAPGIEEGYKVHSFIIRESHIENLKQYAAENRLSIKNAVDDVFSAFFEG